MKPSGWSSMSIRKRRAVAGALLNSLRGNYLLSQALFHALKALKAVPEPLREQSNIEDMEMLREEMFAFPDVCFDHGATLKSKSDG